VSHNHPNTKTNSKVVIYAVQLSLARYSHLLETVKLLCDDEGIAWPAAWRYIERFMRQCFLGSINTVSQLSKQLVAAFREKRAGRRNMIISSPVRGFRDGHMLSKAGGDHQAAVRSAVPTDRGEAAGKAAPLDVPEREIFDKVPGGKCPLCLSKKHKYRAGDYGHKDKNTITQSCARAQPDGNPCGLVHAFAGPLASDCRVLPLYVRD